MNKKRKTLGDVIFMDKGGLADLLGQAAKLRAGKVSCSICGDLYLKGALIDDPEVGCICDGCASAKKELDDEQVEIEKAMRRSE